MLRQQKADGELIGIYRNLIAVILITLFLGIIGSRYFGGVEQVNQGTDVTYNRLLNVLVVVRSQWLAYGKPKQMELDWEVFDSASQTNASKDNFVRMSLKGRPLPVSHDAKGCKRLWQQLMGKELGKQLKVEFHYDGQTCDYLGANRNRISYQLSSGRVLYIPNQEN